MRLADGAWDAMVEMASHGNIASRSDLEVGAKALEAGVWGSARNVAINLPGIEDETYRERVSSEADALASRAAARRDEVIATFARRED
jgi:glutamate formiminotransferase/formiminotetrahydrofolate cyclodeaminase